MRRARPLAILLGAASAMGWAGSAAGARPAAGPPASTATTLWQIEQGLPQNTVNAVAQTPDGYLWLGTAEGLVRFDGVRFVVFDRRNTPAIPNNVDLRAARGPGGALWIGTDSGLVRWKDGAFSAAAGEGAPAGRRITSVIEDGQGRVWVGTAERGLVSIQGGALHRAHRRPGAQQQPRARTWPRRRTAASGWPRRAAG